MTIFVFGIPPAVRPDHLTELFSQYGEVSSARIALDERGLSKRFGFVTMENEEEATAAIAGLNGLRWEGRRLVVEPSRSAGKRAEPAAAKNDRELTHSRDLRRWEMSPLS